MRVCVGAFFLEGANTIVYICESATLSSYGDDNDAHTGVCHIRSRREDRDAYRRQKKLGVSRY